ncbi:hypothetical protein GIB67_037012 [Kingdonia uniflora]|uniref:Uncharacterized protein n=1 Tax=Kingdonia uniflora TaxID=39325 RepID=A0A7J7LHW3_9MAGN|nr:hypothetical protein GIB67_037012 [Kingdonia uniflora]
MGTVREIVCWWPWKDRVSSWHRKRTDSDSKYAKWFSDDSMVRTWLINSKQPTISAGYLFTNNTHLIWESLRNSAVAEIYAKLVEKTRVFQFLAGLNPDFEYVRVHLLDRTPFPTLEETHAYCLFNQSRRSPMPTISGIASETSDMAVRYAYPAPPSVPSQTSHTSSPSFSLLPTASGNSRPPRKKCDYCGK